MDHESTDTVRERVKIRIHFRIPQNGPGFGPRINRYSSWTCQNSDPFSGPKKRTRFWTANQPIQFVNVSKSRSIFGSPKNGPGFGPRINRYSSWTCQNSGVSPPAVVKASTVVLSGTDTDTDGRTDARTDTRTWPTDAHQIILDSLHNSPFGAIIYECARAKRCLNKTY